MVLSCIKVAQQKKAGLEFDTLVDLWLASRKLGSRVGGFGLGLFGLFGQGWHARAWLFFACKPQAGIQGLVFGVGLFYVFVAGVVCKSPASCFKSLAVVRHASHKLRSP